MFFAKQNGKKADIYIYEDIGESWYGGVTAKSFSEELKSIGNVEQLDIYINSPGGNVFDGVAIYNQIVRFDAKKTVHIDGIAASIASIIAMAGDDINIAENAMVMIHNPWGVAIGSASEMRKAADSLDKVRQTLVDTYIARTGQTAGQIGEWMDAETWMSADEAVTRGFATKKTESKKVKAHFPLLDKFGKTPETLRSAAMHTRSLLAHMDRRLQRSVRPTR